MENGIQKLPYLWRCFTGVIIGVAAVALIAIILIGTNGKNADEKPEAADVDAGLPTSGPEPVDTETPAPTSTKVESLQFFARQHGVFTTPSSAATFIAENPSLASAAVIKAEGQYYVWSAVGLTEAEIMDSEIEETFRKRLVVDTSACSVIGAGELQSVLQATETAKIKTSEGEKEGDLAAEFNRNITAITAYTNDMRIIRLRLISHYSFTKECIKITF